MRDGFFAVNVETGPGGLHADERVPMVRSRDHDGIEILPRDHLAKVFVAFHARVAATLFRIRGIEEAEAFIEALRISVVRGEITLVKITDRNALGRLVIHESAHDAPPPVSHPDEAHVDAVAGSVFPKHGGRNNRGESENAGSSGKEATT